MKYLIATVCLAAVGFGFTGCQSPPQTGDQQAIASVLAQKESASLDCQQILIEGREITELKIHGWLFLAAIKKIDVAGCPEPFRAAWSNYCTTWEKKLKAENANEDTLDLISMEKGELGDVPALGRRLEAYDTEPAWQRCEQAAMAYGVHLDYLVQ